MLIEFELELVFLLTDRLNYSTLTKLRLLAYEEYFCSLIIMDDLERYVILLFCQPVILYYLT